MARVRKLNKDRDNDATVSVRADRYYEGGELFVVGNGKRTYVTTHYNGTTVAFSGPKTLRAIADAIKKGLRQKD